MCPFPGRRRGSRRSSSRLLCRRVSLLPSLRGSRGCSYGPRRCPRVSQAGVSGVRLAAPPSRVCHATEYNGRAIEFPSDCADTWGMSRYVVRGAYIFVVVVVCPLVAWHVAVDATDRGF